ncbi:winged helix-turn-helix transcriptional regulator [Nitrososphaera sp.]|uniref:winged helix-turn-helix transcriptional regulator n=1 Tax=Nitrososphaera sp. TaxID=1971748 RepID=UPI00307F9B25
MHHHKGTKDSVYGYIAARPGSYFREILRSLGIGTGNLQYIVEALEREGRITVVRIGSYKHFYPSDIDEKKKNILSIISQESPREILLFLSRRPGACQTDVAREIRCSSPTARWYLLRLESLGLVRSLKEGAVVKYYANTTIPELASLLQAYRPHVWSRYADRMADMLRAFDRYDDGGDGDGDGDGKPDGAF